MAKAFGDAIRQAGVPVGKVYTSKYNRAYETAVIAGFKNIEKTADITEGGLVVSPNENSTTIDGVRIAYPDVGHGPLLVKAANYLNHLEYDWASPVWSPFFNKLAANRRPLRLGGQ